MLHRIRTRWFVYAVDQRHLPIGAAFAPDDAAESAPFAEIARRRIEPEASGRAAVFVEVIAVPRRASGHPGRKRRRPALEIAAGAEHAVGIDDDTGVAH